MDETAHYNRMGEINTFFSRVERGLSHPGIPEPAVREIALILTDFATRCVRVHTRYRHLRLLYEADEGAAYILLDESLAALDESVFLAVEEYPDIRVYFNDRAP